MTDVLAAPGIRSGQPTGTPARPPRRRHNRWRVVVVTVASLAVVAAAAAPYLTLDPSVSRVGLRENVPWHFPLLLVHIFTGAVALSTGPWQFVRRIRRRRRVHRYLGRIYLFAGVFPASLTGLVVAPLTTAGPVAASGLFVGSAGWLFLSVLGYRAARTRRYRDHERWMIRGFALTFAAVTFRVWLGILIMVQLPWLGSAYAGDFDALFGTAYALTTWLAFYPNLLAVEWYFRRRRSARGTGNSAVLSGASATP